jgi:biopolymer transport protein ExbB
VTALQQTTIKQFNEPTIQQNMTLLQIQEAVNDLGTAAAETAVQTEKLSAFELATKGGWIMIVLAVLSIIAVYIFIERYIAVSRATKYDASFMDRIREYMKDGKLDSAKALCRGNSTPISRMIEKGLSRIGRPLSDINSAIENEGNIEVAQLERGVNILAMIASAAPMIGFLGTVIGMIRAFYDMSMAGNNLDITTLSNGIYTAMVTTVGGLIVGIIAYFFHAILSTKIQKVVNLLEAKATEFMDVLNEPA